MTTEIEVRQMPAQRVLVKKATCAQDNIGPTFGATVGAVGRCFTASGATMKSAPMCVYTDWRETDCDIAVGCLVEGDVTLTEGCEWLDMPGGPAATASHFGPYDTLGETHHALMDWVKANGHEFASSCWEIYPVDPTLEPDPSKWQTDVFYPIK